MKDKLLELHNNSYAIYSNYPVSSCVVMKDGKEYYGVNVEDASTRAGCCAERVAIFNAISDGYKKGDFPIAEQYADEVLSLPMYNGMTFDEQSEVISAVNNFYVMEEGIWG